MGSLNKSPTGCGQTAVGLVPTPRPPPFPIQKLKAWTATGPTPSLNHYNQCSAQLSVCGDRWEGETRAPLLLNSPESRLVLHSGLLHPKTALMLISKTRISYIFSLKGANPHSGTHPVVCLLKRIQSTNYILWMFGSAHGACTVTANQHRHDLPAALTHTNLRLLLLTSPP